MNFGEKLNCNEKGEVFGDETGRLVAKFSHQYEAESFCNFYNNQYTE